MYVYIYIICAQYYIYYRINCISAQYFTYIYNYRNTCYICFNFYTFTGAYMCVCVSRYNITTFVLQPQLSLSNWCLFQKALKAHHRVILHSCESFGLDVNRSCGNGCDFSFDAPVVMV